MNDKSYTRVGAVMTPAPKVINGLATVEQAIALMREHGISSVVVDRREEGDEYGLVVVSDIASMVIGRDRSPQRTNVYEIMSKPVVTVDRDMDIKYAIRLLDRFQLSRALVTEEGSLVGIVTMRDMVLHYTAAGEPAAAT